MKILKVFRKFHKVGHPGYCWMVVMTTAGAWRGWHSAVRLLARRRCTDCPAAGRGRRLTGTGQCVETRSTRNHTDTWNTGREMFYLTTHSTHFIYGYMVSHIWLRTILIVRKETLCHHMGYSYRLTARVLLYPPSHRQDNTYPGLCYTSRGALPGTRNSSMGPPHEGSIIE